MTRSKVETAAYLPSAYVKEVYALALRSRVPKSVIYREAVAWYLETYGEAFHLPRPSHPPGKEFTTLNLEAGQVEALHRLREAHRLPSSAIIRDALGLYLERTRAHAPRR